MPCSCASGRTRVWDASHALVAALQSALRDALQNALSALVTPA